MPSKSELQQQLNDAQRNLERYKVVDQYLPMAVEIGRRVTAAVDDEELGFVDIVEVVDTVMDDITEEERKKRVLDAYSLLAPQDKLRVMATIFGNEGMESALQEEHERIVREGSLHSAIDKIRQDARTYNRIPVLEIPPNTPVELRFTDQYDYYRRKLLFETVDQESFKLTDDIFSHSNAKSIYTTPVILGETYGLYPDSSGVQSTDSYIYFDNGIWIVNIKDHTKSKMLVTDHNHQTKVLNLAKIIIAGNDIRSQAKKLPKVKR